MLMRRWLNSVRLRRLVWLFLGRLLGDLLLDDVLLRDMLLRGRLVCHRGMVALLLVLVRGVVRRDEARCVRGRRLGRGEPSRRGGLIRRSRKILRLALGVGVEWLLLLMILLLLGMVLGGLGILDGLEDAGGLEGLEGVLLLEVARVGVLDAHADAVEGGVGDDLDGRVVLDDGRDAVLGAGRGDGVRPRRADAERHDADGAADGHAAQHVALAGDVRGAVPLEVPLDDVALLARVVDGRRRHGDADGRHPEREGDGEPGDGRRRRGPRDEPRVVLPLPLELFGSQAEALCVVGLEVERHLFRGGRPHFRLFFFFLTVTGENGSTFGEYATFIYQQR